MEEFASRVPFGMQPSHVLTLFQNCEWFFVATLFLAFGVSDIS